MSKEALDHDEAARLLPWLANGTLAGEERTRAEQHVRQCLVCRSELAEQEALRTLVRSQPTVPVSAEANFERLLARLDGTAAARQPGRARWWREPSAVRGFSQRSGARVWAVAATVLIGLGAVLALVSSYHGEPQEDAAYGTLSPATETGLIDVIFSSDTSEADRRAFMVEHGVEIVAGPSARLGRYTLRIDAAHASARGIEPLLLRLQADPRVRFAGPAYSAAEGAR